MSAKPVSVSLIHARCLPLADQVGADSSPALFVSRQDRPVSTSVSQISRPLACRSEANTIRSPSGCHEASWLCTPAGLIRRGVGSLTSVSQTDVPSRATD